MSAAEIGFQYRFEPGENASAPIVLLLHGTGGDENDLVPLGRTIAPSAALLSPRGQVLENGMPRFFRRIAEGVFDQEDLAVRTSELADFLTKTAPVPPMAVGFSNGANIAASLLLRYPERLAGGILIRAMVPFVPDKLPNLAGKPILMLSGDRDSIVPVEQPQQLASIFSQAGAAVSLEWAHAGHGLLQEEVNRAREWLGTVNYGHR
jgi:predicted esterase